MVRRSRSSYTDQWDARLAAAFGAGLLVWSLATPTSGAAAKQSFACAENRHFSVRHAGPKAIVQIEGKSYALQRRPSTFGERYAAPGTTLIVDGQFASLVARDLPRVRQCYLETTIAGRRR